MPISTIEDDGEHGPKGGTYNPDTDPVNTGSQDEFGYKQENLKNVYADRSNKKKRKYENY